VRRLLLVALLALLLPVARQAVVPREAAAEVIVESARKALFPPPNPRHYGYGQYNKLIPKVRGSGVLTWRATDNYGWAPWRSVVARAMDTGSDYAYSLGNVLASHDWNVSVREAASWEAPDIEFFAESSGFVAAKCGGEFAVACVRMLDPLPVPVYVRAAAVATYVFSGQAATLEHETWHPLAQACDQYAGFTSDANGNCVPSASVQFRCTSNPDTLMDCNLSARFPQPYDMETAAYVYFSARFERCNLGFPPPCAGLDGPNKVVWWCDRDAKAQYVYVFFREPDGFVWSRSEFWFLADGRYCQSVDVPALPGRCIWVRQVNTVDVTVNANETFVGCI